MCYAASCNPSCGQCRPKRIFTVHCPDCGAPREVTREEYLILFDLPHRKNPIERKLIERGAGETPYCKGCGRDLTETVRGAIVPAPCRAQRILCGFPCGRSSEPEREGAMPCPTMVPLQRLDISHQEREDRDEALPL